MGRVCENFKVMAEKFSLKWNDFQPNIAKSFTKLRQENDFYDVTLVSDDQRQVFAHKVVLSSCSEYFKTVLKQNKHHNLLLCLEGVTFDELNSILDYIYNGEIQLHENDLDRFLRISQRLKLEGLVTEENSNDNIIPEEVFKKQNDERELVLKESLESIWTKVSSLTQKESSHQRSENKELVNVHTSNVIIANSDTFDTIEELDQKISEHIEKSEDGKWKCNICDKKLRFRSHAKEHVEIHFDNLSFPCQLCGVTVRSRNAMRSHIYSSHSKVNALK